MNKQSKALTYGFCFGFIMVWLLYLIIIPLFGTGNFSRDFMKIFNHSETILQQSLIFGGFCAIMYLIICVCSQRHKEKKELEDTMTEYFRKQNEKE